MNKEHFSLRKIAGIFADNPALIAVTSMPDRKYVEVNRAFTDSLGYTREETIGRTINEMGLMSADDLAAMIAEVQKTGKITDLELQVKTKAGAFRTLLFSGNVIESGGENYFFMVSVDITEQRSLQLKLAEQKQKLENVIEGTGLGTWEWNVQTGETIFNERWAEIIGYTLAELQPVSIETWLRFIHPDDIEKSQAALQKCFARETDAFACETRVKHKNGRWLWIADRGKVTEWTADGRPLKMFGTHADITPQKKAEEELKESERRFNLALEATDAGLWDWDMKRDTVYYSPKWKNMLGYADHEIENTVAGWKNLWHPDDAPAIEKAMDDYLHGRAARYEISHRLRHKNGEWRWILTRGGALANKNGIPYRWIGTNIDITEDKNSADELERFFSVNLDLLCIADLQGNFVKTNKAWTDILGYSQEELENRKFLEFVHPDDLDATLQAMAKLAGREQVLNFVNRYRTKDGGYRYIEWRSHPYGSLIYAAARDITERIETEERIRQISLRDPLTGIYNRRFIFERLETILAEYRRTGRSFAVAMLDIDLFKAINDRFGHLAGDFILREFTRVLGANLRPYDILGRYGGEEFIVVSPSTGKDQAVAMMTRVLDKIRKAVFDYNGTAISFTFSGGVVDCLDFEASELSAEKIIEKADNRLYTAKQTGRNRIIPTPSRPLD
ncbi:MAG: PAS domain-containing protein [Sporomusaceae bacterium]|nr:PAS domain-containing protein [Sporomusaceae bacterium]